MLHPSAQELIKHNQSRYSLVMAASKIAGKLAGEAEERGEKLPVKPIKAAVEMLRTGEMDFRESFCDDTAGLNIKQYPVMSESYSQYRDDE